MDPHLTRQMLTYYNERASEYEQAYTSGRGTASIDDPTVFTKEVPALAAVVSRFGRGHLVDLACGTAFWLPHYASRCTRITLFDQSENMLAQAARKVRELDLTDRCELLQGNIELLRRILRPGGRFLILDSAWTETRARFNQKVERQPRRLDDGTTFEVYKRYLDREDVRRWADMYHASVQVDHFGAPWCAMAGEFREPVVGKPSHT